MSKKWWNLFVEFEGENPGSSASDGSEPLDLDDVDALLARTRALTGDVDTPDEAPPPPEPVTATPPPLPPSAHVAPVSAAAPAFIEGRSFDQIYAEQGCVPPAPKTVDEVIRFLDGLKAMPTAVQHQALDAMDQADTTWTIEDVILDAHNKVEALRRASQSLQATVQVARQRCQEEMDAQDQLSAAATEKIGAEIASLREQIASLESLKDQELAEAQLAKASAQESIQATEQQCGRETARYEHEIARLTQFIQTFSGGVTR